MTWKTCPACQRKVFSNGGHQVGCSLDALGGLRKDFAGSVDREPLDEQRFVSVWDEVTYYTDGLEGDRS
jgi:hypothetical protein